MKFYNKKPTPEMTHLLRMAGSLHQSEAIPAQRELFQALETPLKKGIINGDTTGNIFEPIYFAPGVAPEFPLDLLAPGTEKEHVAYAIPRTGRIPERAVQGDYVMGHLYEIGNSIDWSMKYARDARWDIVGRAMQVLEGGFVRKDNSDAWHTILAAAVARNLVVYDDAAVAGLFTPRLLSLMKVIMRRNAGGNSTSMGRGRLTDLYVSPEAYEDMRTWDNTIVPEAIRASLFNQSDDGEGDLNMVKLHTLDELGVGQEYQNYFSTVLGGSLPSDKVEIVVGIDQSTNDSFIKPWREEVQIFPDDNFHRQRRAGMYGWAEHGWLCLDGRRVLLGAL